MTMLLSRKSAHVACRRQALAALLLVIGGLSGFAAVAAPDLPGLAVLQATRQRPLFSPTRRPPPPPPPVAEDDAPAPGAVTLAPPPSVEVKGIIVGTDRSVAIVKRPQDQTAIPISIGGRIDGWTVSAIDQRAIVLRLGERSVIVAMPDPGR